MDEKTLLEAVSQHLGLLSSLQWWMLVTALATIYMVVTDKDELDLKFFKATKENAEVLVGVLYLIVTASFFVVLVRLHGLLGLLPGPQMPAAATEIATHSWLFNPFAYFGDSGFYQFVSLASLLALIAAWWLGLVSLSLLRGKFPRAGVVLGIIFVALSGLTLVAMQQVYFLMVSKTAQQNAELSAKLASLKESRLSLITWGSIVALVASLVAIGLIERHKRAKKEAAEAMRLSVANILD